MKNAFILLIFSLFYAYESQACDVPYVVTFFTGIAMNDGTGDLATSAKMINELQPRLQAKYGDCLKVQVVFNVEPFKNINERNEISQWKRIRDFFQEGVFQDISKSLFTEVNGVVTHTNKIITQDNITFMTDETYLNSKLESDLQIQTSALREIDNQASHDLSKALIKKGKLTLIFEEAEGLYPAYGHLLSGDITYHYRSSYKNHNYVRVHTGVKSSGFYFKDETKYPAMSVEEIVNNFQDQNKYQTLTNTLLPAKNPQIYHVYTSKKGITQSVLKSLNLAYEQSQLEPSKRFVLVQNGIDSNQIKEFEKIVGSKNPHLLEFLKTKVSMILQKNIPSHEFRSLQFHSRFPIVTGDMSFADALNMGKIPLYEARNHKLAHISDMHDTYLEEFEKLKTSGKLPPGFNIEDENQFKKLIQYSFLSDTSLEIQNIPSQEVYMAAENKKVLSTLSLIKKDLNINRSLFNFVEGSIDALYKTDTEFTPNVRDYFILDREKYVDQETRRKYAEVETVNPNERNKKLEAQIKTPSFFTRCLLKSREAILKLKL